MTISIPKDSDTWIWVGIVGMLGACVSLMCILLVCISLVVFNAAMLTRSISIGSSPQVPSSQSTLVPPEDGSFIGLWKYPDRFVWIKITEEGRAFQCRIAKDGTVFRSEGTLLEGDKILWQDIWGVDSITREANHIALDGKYGKFEYEFSDIEMDPACEAPF
jgi:hypothetical protein